VPCRADALLVVGNRGSLENYSQRRAIFTAFGRIANVRRNGSVGVEFIDVADKDQLVLEKWMAELREEAGQHSKIS
jgi:hypothetical protein